MSNVKEITEKKPYSAEHEKKKEMYLLWRSMPAMLRMLKDEDLRKMGYDIDDPMFKKLIEIKNDSQFCTMFELSNNQPARWRKDEEFMKEVNRLALHEHVQRFGKDVDFSFTQKTIRHGDAGRVKLWNQLFRGWTEKTENINTNRNLDVVELVKEIERRNEKIRSTKKVSSEAVE